MAKILVIDDDGLMRSVLQKMLTYDGHKIFVAKDGVEGLQCFYDVNFNLVITDIVMPNKNGIEVIVELRQSHPNLPIISMSGGHYEIPAKLGLEVENVLGASLTLQKPFTHKELQEAIAVVLNE